MPRRSLPKLLWYGYLHVVCRLLAASLARVRIEGRGRVPSRGGVLVLCNHQSYLDPVLVGLACDRRLSFLARETLFRFRPFRWLIQSLDAIAIDREGLGLSGVKETLRRLKQGDMVLMFPEGTRTRDGNLGPMKSGFGVLAKRAGVPLLPMAIAGAYEAWPRQQRLPGLSTIQIEIGALLSADEVTQLDEQALSAEVQRRLQACLTAAEAKRKLRRGYGG